MYSTDTRRNLKSTSSIYSSGIVSIYLSIYLYIYIYIYSIIVYNVFDVHSKYNKIQIIFNHISILSLTSKNTLTRCNDVILIYLKTTLKLSFALFYYIFIMEKTTEKTVKNGMKN